MKLTEGIAGSIFLLIAVYLVLSSKGSGVSILQGFGKALVDTTGSLQARSGGSGLPVPKSNARPITGQTGNRLGLY